MSRETIAVVVTTFNNEEAYKALYDTIPVDKIDLLVTVNGGEEYTGSYPNTDWTQHLKRKNIAQSRNDGLRQVQDFDHIFLIEDDMIIKNPDIFDAYIEASKVSGLEYLTFASYAWDSGPVGGRTPAMTAEYKNKQDQIIGINFYRNMCNEFTYRSKRLLKEAGFYDESYKSTFDVDWSYKASLLPYVSNFWYFADKRDSDEYIKNNDQVQSRIDPDGNRWEKLAPDYAIFRDKYKTDIGGIPCVSQDTQVERLKSLLGK